MALKHPTFGDRRLRGLAVWGIGAGAWSFLWAHVWLALMGLQVLTVILLNPPAALG